jgi:5-formyltetrahydrofolate cyclo-ligase
VNLKQENPIRKRILQTRKSLLASEVERLSREISWLFLEKFESKRKALPRLRIGMYRAFQSELDLSFLEVPLSSFGFDLFYPRVARQDSSRLEFVQISPMADPTLSWKISPYGFHEPHPELPMILPENLDMIFVPGVAFGPSGERVGRGAGHYDRFLAQVPNALRIGLAYDFQVVQELIQNPWDQPVHWLLTEKREYQAPQVQAWFQSRERA